MDDTDRKFFKALRITGYIIAGLLVFGMCTTIVPAGHNGVRALFGDVYEKPLPQGFHIINPLVWVSTFDLRNQKLDLQDIEVPARDRLKARMDITVTYRLNGERTPNIYEKTGTAYRLEETIIKPHVRSVLREAGKTIDRSQDFFLDHIQTQLQEFVFESTTAYLADFGVEVVSILFRDVDLPVVVKEAIEAVKEREEQVIREQAELERVTLQEKQRIAKADAQLQAASKEAEAIKITADAQAYANRVVAQSISPALTRYRQWTETWDGVLPRFLGADADLLVPVEPE